MKTATRQTRWQAEQLRRAVIKPPHKKRKPTPVSNVVTITRNAENIVGIVMAGPADMLTVLEAACGPPGAPAGFGYTGEILAFIDPGTGNMVYRLKISNATQGDQFANVGDWVTLWNNSIVTVMSSVSFLAKFTPTSPS
jgi:hypothetical protein